MTLSKAPILKPLVAQNFCAGWSPHFRYLLRKPPLNFQNSAGKSCERINVTSGMNCDDYTSTLATTNISDLKMEECSKDELIFDQSVVLTSVTVDYGFTCEELFLKSVFNSLYLGGMLVGSFIIGLISDKFGRLKARLYTLGWLFWSI